MATACAAPCHGNQALDFFTTRSANLTHEKDVIMREMSTERMRSMVEKIHYRDPLVRTELRHAGNSFQAVSRSSVSLGSRST